MSPSGLRTCALRFHQGVFCEFRLYQDRPTKRRRHYRPPDTFLPARLRCRFSAKSGRHLNHPSPADRAASLCLRIRHLLALEALPPLPLPAHIPFPYYLAAKEYSRALARCPPLLSVSQSVDASVLPQGGILSSNPAMSILRLTLQRTRSLPPTMP